MNSIQMENETIIRGRFVSVHLPSYSSCNPDLLNFSIFDENNFCSLLPKPYITVEDSFGFQQQQATDPDQFNKLATNLELALNTLSLISPFSISKRPLRSFDSFTEFKKFTVYEKMEENDEVLKLKEKIKAIPSLF